MSHRHHLAEKVGEEGLWHLYRYTHDSLLMKDWRTVKMGDAGFEVIQVAPDDAEWGWSKEYRRDCCISLFVKFLRIKNEEGVAPREIEFVA